jgi:hypothetical protein
MARTASDTTLARPEAGRHATGGPRSRRPGLVSMATPQGTPSTIQALIALMVILALAWGGFGAWAVDQHSSAASSLAHADEQYSSDAQQLYLAIADADVTITTSFLRDSSTQDPPSSLVARQRFNHDLILASGYLADLRNPGGSPQFTQAVATIAGGMPDYYRDVQTAQTEYTQGITPAGDSAMEVASEDAHLTLLPAARELYQLENNAVMASSSQATSVMTVIIAFVVAIIAAVALFMVQRWLGRRTNRVFNVGLVAASAALLISALWVAGAFVVARSDLSTAIGQGAHPAESLAQASIDVQQIRGDSILNVIARSGSPTLSQDSCAQALQVGPSPSPVPAGLCTKGLPWPTGSGTLSGTLLGNASSAGNAQVTSDLRAAISNAPGWYAANAADYSLGNNYLYPHEQTNVFNAAATFASVETSVNTALAAAQATFKSQADAGANAFGPVEAIVIAAALVMAGASAWGLSARLGEYR